MASYRRTKNATAGCMCTVMKKSHGFISQDQHVMGQGYVKRKHTLLFRVVNDKNIARSQGDTWQMKTSLSHKDKGSINQDRPLTARIPIC